MKEHDIDVQQALDIMPEAEKGGGTSAAYANECICLSAENETQFEALSQFVIRLAPGIIDSILPLTNDGAFGWDDAQTMFALIPQGNRGIVKFEKGLNDTSSSHNDCYYIRFFGFKSADVPYSGSSALIRDISEALRSAAPRTKIIPDTSRTSYTIEAERRKSQAWKAQGLCEHCGGTFSMFGKCKSCGRKR